MTHELATQDYRCTVTLLLEDVTEERALRFFAEGADVDGTGPNAGYVAMIEAPGQIEVQS